MKLTQLILASIIILSGCHKNTDSVTEPNALKESKIIKGIGSHVSPSKNWEVALSETDPQLSVKFIADGKSNHSITPKGWNNAPNAFVFFDSNDCAWVFDGSSGVVIAEMTKSNHFILWGLEAWTNDIPETIAPLILPE